MHALRIHDGNIYLDGTRIEGVKKYSLDWEQDELPLHGRVLFAWERAFGWTREETLWLCMNGPQVKLN